MSQRLLSNPSAAIPAWALQRPKSVPQRIYDLVGAPLRMIVLPDDMAERLHLTSLRGERFAVVLTEMRGRCLDVGAGDDQLIQLYRRAQVGRSPPSVEALASIGVDVVDWGGTAQRIESAAALPFEDAAFDTVCFVASLNHIPERTRALVEARRVLRSGGRVLVTMIERLLGTVGHAVWWYSEDKHRAVADGELMGMDQHEVMNLLLEAGFKDIEHRRFFYGLNHLFIAVR